MESMVKDSDHLARSLPSFAELVSDLNMNRNPLAGVLKVAISMEEEDPSTGNIIGERDTNGTIVKNMDLVSHNDDTVLARHLAAPSDQIDIVRVNRGSAEHHAYNGGNVVKDRTTTGDDDNRHVSKKNLTSDSFPTWIKDPLMVKQVSPDSRSISDTSCCYDVHMVPATDNVPCWFETGQVMEDISSNSIFNSESVQGHNKMVHNSLIVPNLLANGNVIEHIHAMVGFDRSDNAPTREGVDAIMLQNQTGPKIDQGTGQQSTDESFHVKRKEIANSNEPIIVWSENGSMLHKMEGPIHSENMHNSSTGSVYKHLPSQEFMNNTANSYEVEIFDGKETSWPSFGDNEVNSEVDVMNNNRQGYGLATCPMQSDHGKELTHTYMAAQSFWDKTFCDRKQDEKMHPSLESIQVCPSDKISEDMRSRPLPSQREHRLEMGQFALSSLGTQAYPNLGSSWLRMPQHCEAYSQNISTYSTSARFLYQPLIYPDCRNEEGRRGICFSQFDTETQENILPEMPYSSHIKQKLEMETIDTYDELSSDTDRLSLHDQHELCENDDALMTMEHNTMHRQTVLTKSYADYQRQQQIVSMLHQDASPSDIGSVATETSPFAGQVNPLTRAYAISTPYFMDQKFPSAEFKVNQNQKSSVSSSTENILQGAQRKELWLGDYSYFDLQASVPRLNSFEQDNQLYRQERMAPVKDSTKTLSWMDPQVSDENLRPVNPNLINSNCISTVSRRDNPIQTQMYIQNCEECSTRGIDNFPLVNRKIDVIVRPSCFSSPSIHTDVSSLSVSSDSREMKNVPSTRRKRKTSSDNRLRRPKNGFIRFANEKRKELSKKYPRLNNRQISRLLGNRWKQMSNEDKEPYELSFYEELKKIRDEQPEWKWRTASESKDTNEIMTTRLRPRNKLKVQHSLDAIIGHSARSLETEHGKSAEPRFGNKACWVQCDLCLKWRQLPEGVVMETEIPALWFCYMNPDTSKSACYVEEELPAPSSH